MRILQGVLLLLSLGYLSVMFYMTHTPQPAPIGPDAGDKLRHFLGFSALGVVLYLTLWIIRPRSPWVGIIVMVVAMAYGAFDETTQPLAGRTCDAVDWMADVAGAATAVTFMGLLHWLTYPGPAASKAGRRP